MLSVSHILRDGLLVSIALGIVIFGSLYYNPRLWLHEYPAALRAKVPPLTPIEKRQQRILVVVVLLLIFGVPWYSTYQLRLENGGNLPFLAAYLNTLLVTNIFNLFDAVVIDLLILALMKPQFAVIPGMEGVELDHFYHDWNMHLRNYLKGIVVCSILSLPITIIAML